MTIRGMGSLFQPWYRDRKTGERRHSPTWWIAYSFRGTKIRECSHSTKRQDAARLLKKRIGDITQGRIGPQLDRTSFDDLANIIKTDYEVNSRKSTARMLTSLNGLRPFFGMYLAKDITFDRLNAFIAHRLTQSMSPASIRIDLSILKRAFRLGERAGKALCPPFPTIQVHNVRSGFFEEDEFRLLLHHLPEEIQPLITFAYFTGWRVRSEVMPLQWRQVNLSAGVVRLEPGTTKNDEGRQFPFGRLPELEQVLTLQRQRTNEVQTRTGKSIPWVFHRNGIPIRDFTKVWRIACLAADVSGRIPHDFRRTAVRNLERAGVSRSAAMKLTGHKTESVYRRYAIVSEADLAEGVQKLARLETSSGKARAKQTVLESGAKPGNATKSLIMVPEAGIEPARAFWTRGILSPLRLPISPLRQQRPHSGGTLTSRSRWVKVVAVGTHSLIPGCVCHRFDH